MKAFKNLTYFFSLCPGLGWEGLINFPVKKVFSICLNPETGYFCNIAYLYILFSSKYIRYDESLSGL